MNNSKKISSKHYSLDWSENLSNRNSNDWDIAIKIVEDRFFKRYINPLSKLLNNEDKAIKYNCGFIIMSIDCLLIETLNQFYFGLKETNEKYYRENKDDKFRYHSQAFRDFFNYSKNFQIFKNHIKLPEIFYIEIRCGLLHQAQSKVNSLINIKKKNMIEPVDGKDFENGIVVNRSIFHNAVVSDFKRYINDLKNPDSTNLEGDYLRDMCNKKMTALL